MQGHFKHLHFKTFLMVSWGGHLVLVFLFNQGSKHLQLPHECNSQNGNALESYWVSSLALSPSLVRVCFTPKHTLSFIFENVFHT
jgi:hypothetical protein